MDGVFAGRKVDKNGRCVRKWSGEAWGGLRGEWMVVRKCGWSFDWEKSR